VIDMNPFAWITANPAQSFSWLSVALALVAAVLWGISAWANLPVIGSSYEAIDQLEPFHDAMKKVARLNMRAATFAALSALCQAIALALSK
jgi:hypothetical protein